MLSDYLLRASKHLSRICTARHLAILLALFVCASGGLIVWYLPNVYQSETSVYVVPQPQPLVKSIFQLEDNAEDFGDIARARILSNAKLKKVAIAHDMLLDARSEIAQRTVLNNLKKDVCLVSQSVWREGKGFYLLTISYRDVDAERSKSVVGSLLDMFLYGNDDNDRALAFLDKQIEHSSALLKDAEDQLTRFRAENARFEHNHNPSDLSEAVFGVAELENKFRKLNRNAIAHRERYEHFLQRYSEARVPSSDNPRALEYQFVEAPKTLPDPVSPNRPLLSLIHI